MSVYDTKAVWQMFGGRGEVPAAFERDFAMRFLNAASEAMTVYLMAQNGVVLRIGCDNTPPATDVGSKA